MKILLGYILVKVGFKICGEYYICDNCYNLQFKEKEVLCWKCGGRGQMIYQGNLNIQFLDKYGWPVERIKGRKILNFIRLIIHTRNIGNFCLHQGGSSNNTNSPKP
jgi:hypothetical protein